MKFEEKLSHYHSNFYSANIKKIFSIKSTWKARDFLKKRAIFLKKVHVIVKVIANFRLCNYNYNYFKIFLVNYNYNYNYFKFFLDNYNYHYNYNYT